ncbi:MAG: glycerol-3-phosphate acyltransferase [Anaerolineales bacterium]|nr:glycerol-3-phosphate acyltransferase [Anaerolineales bacterium]
MTSASTLNDLVWIVIAFVCGALPFSYWLGKVVLHVDIRQYGDGNPGAANVWRAGGKWWGVLAILLDAFKGCIPVAFAVHWAGVSGWALVLVALAPIIGHAYTPFLNFQGGKALAVTFGIWTALTVWFAPVVLGLALAVWLKVLVVEGWAILFGMLTLLVAFWLTGADWTLYWVWLGSLLLLLWKHRTDFRHAPPVRRGVLAPIFSRARE